MPTLPLSWYDETPSAIEKPSVPTKEATCPTLRVLSKHMPNVTKPPSLPAHLNHAGLWSPFRRIGWTPTVNHLQTPRWPRVDWRHGSETVWRKRATRCDGSDFKRLWTSSFVV